MNDDFGPWTTAVDGRPALDAFWKRRLTMLHKLSQCRHVGTRLRAGLILGGVALCALPTVHQMIANAQTSPPPAEPIGQQLPTGPVSPPVEPPPRAPEAEPAVPAQTTERAEFPGRSPGSGGGMSLDLVSLANSYVEAQSALDAAELRLQQLEPFANQRVVSEQEFSKARLAHTSAARRLRLLRKIIEVSRETTAMELEGLKGQLKLLEERYKANEIGLDRIVSVKNRETQARRNLLILEAILESK
ncbi:MAG: hypothetical protein ACREJB_07580 [Planctomycetaceae bacterium]